MIGTLKSLVILGAVASTAMLAQTAKADHVSVGFGISAPIVVSRPAPVYYTPTYSAPQAVAYSTPAYAAPAYYPPTVVYTAPPVVYYSAPVYSTPVYAPAYSGYGYGSSYYSTPSFGLNLGFIFGGGHDNHGGYHGGGGHGGGGHGGHH